MAEEDLGLLAQTPPLEEFYTDARLVWALCIGNALGAVAHGVGIALTVGLTWCTQYELPMFTITSNLTTPSDPPRYLGDGVNVTRFKPVLEECCPLDPRGIILGFFALSFSFHVVFALVLLCGRPQDREGPRRASFVAVVARWYLRCLADCRAPWYAPLSPAPRGPTSLHTKARAAGGGSSTPFRRRSSSRSRCASSARATSSCCGR